MPTNLKTNQNTNQREKIEIFFMTIFHNFHDFIKFLHAKDNVYSRTITGKISLSLLDKMEYNVGTPLVVRNN